ncbi:integrase, partial [Streptomyces sp. A73]|nr:integrase [Streptomyces sp. A73]
TSINHYRKILRAQIWPHWGSTPLVEITTHQYKAWKNSLEATYTANYVRDILKVFGMLMDDAVDHRPPLLPASPV